MTRTNQKASCIPTAKAGPQGRTKPRIAIFLSHYPQAGGTSSTLRGISRALVHLGYSVTVYCCATGNGRLKDGLTIDVNFPVHQYEPKSRNPFHVPKLLLQRILNNEDRIDLLMIHGFFNARNVSIARAARAAGIPYVSCPSGLYHPEIFQKHRIRKWIFSLCWERPLLRGACAIQTFTELQLKYLSPYKLSMPIFVVPNGFDPKEMDQSAPGADTHRTFWPSEGARFLYLGRIDLHTKGLDLLLHGVSLGLKTGQLKPPFRLNLVGADQGDRVKLERIAEKLSMTEYVRFFGRVDDQARWAVISSCDVLVLPSRHDAFPTTIIEAMAMSKPVIVSDQTGVTRFVAEANCGYIVQPTAESIRDGFARALATREQWTAIGWRGKELAYRTLTWHSVAKIAGEAYDRLWKGILAV